MVEPRLASDIQVKALQRLAEAQGNFMAILHRGDPVSGSIIILARKRSELPVVYERFPSIDGDTKWEKSGPKNAERERDFADWIAKRRRNDPDLWAVELDIASDEQFTELLV